MADCEQHHEGGGEVGSEAVPATAAAPHQPNPGRHRRQIGDRGGQQELAEGLRPADVARLADTEFITV